MSTEQADQDAALKKNLWLLVLAGGLILTGILAYIFGASDQTDMRTPQAASPEAQRLREILDTAPVAEPEDPEDAIIAQIEAYRARVESEPDHPDKPAWLMAMGNLYFSRLTNYVEAARCYEEIVLRHSDWESARAAFPPLLQCYEALNDDMGILRTYQQIMAQYPEDTQEHQYAKDRLGL